MSTLPIRQTSHIIYKPHAAVYSSCTAASPIHSSITLRPIKTKQNNHNFRLSCHNRSFEAEYARVKALTLFQVLHASFVSIVFNQLGSSLVGQIDRGRLIFILRNRQKYLFRNSPGPVKVTKLAKDSETHINTTSNNI